MLAKERREEIISLLEKSQKPIPANQLGRIFNVSRQIIVGDIAILRAADHDIVSTTQGYLMNKGVVLQPIRQYTGKIVCMHTAEQTQKELSIILDHGGTVLDVQIDHPIYGILSADLKIATSYDMQLFLERMTQHQGELLCSLTNGIHIHTLQTDNEQQFNQISSALLEANILYPHS